MTTSKIIIVTGAPATGKTTLARAIAEKFTLPRISKDDIKESLFDSLGWSDREWSRKLGAATYRLLYYYLEAMITAQQLLLIESDFRPAYDTPQLRALATKYPVAYLVIHCTARPDIIQQRVQHRMDTGQRHPGHVDQENVDTFTTDVIANDFGPLEIGGTLLSIDTSTVAGIDYEPLWPDIHHFLNA